MGFKKLIYGIVPVLAVFIHADLHAQQNSKDAFVPQSDSMFVVKQQGKTFNCARKPGTKAWLPGYYKKKTGLFSPVKSLIREQRKALKSIPASAAAQKQKVTKKLNKDLDYQKAAAKVCKAGIPTGKPGSKATPAPTATPQSGSGPKATPTPNVPSNACFSGYDTIKEKGCFGIPKGSSGNKGRGETYYKRYCTGCHGDKPNRTYPQVVSSLTSQPEARPFMPDNQQDLYDIVAYLNRFTL